jgi:hypothetical protein
MPKGEDDYISQEFSKRAAKKFKKGKFKASETGARELAAARYAHAQNREIMNAAGEGTADFEDRAVKRSPRPTRKKRY